MPPVGSTNMKGYIKSTAATFAFVLGIALWSTMFGRENKDVEEAAAAAVVPAGSAVEPDAVHGLKVDFYDFSKYKDRGIDSIDDARNLAAEGEPTVSWPLNARSLDLPHGAEAADCREMTLGEFLLGEEELLARKKAARAGEGQALPARFDEKINGPSIFIFTGFVEVAKAGTYRIAVAADDAAEITIGGALAHVQTARHGEHAPHAPMTISQVYFAKAGIYPVRVLFYNQAGRLGLKIYSDSAPRGEASADGKRAFPAFVQARPAGPSAKRWTPPRFTKRKQARRRMVEVIRNYGLTDESVLKAMAAVPRHEFVPKNLFAAAYSDSPLPIGYGQTISQPYIVAEMTRRLQLEPDSRVLEIGTGSGYQAAVLTEFTPHVYSIEIIKPLADAAAKRLSRLGYDVVRVRHGDGYYGWPEEAPFDAIIVTAAAGQIPPPLLRQLAPGGRMIIPVGSPFATQSLMLVTKDQHGTIRSRSLMAVRFVPLTRKEK